MLYVHWGSVGVAVVTATTLAFATPKGESHESAAMSHEGESRSCTEIADGPRLLHVRMLETGMDAAVLALVRAEVSAIWKQYAIDIAWEEKWTPDKPKPDLWVQFVDVALQSKGIRGAPAIAWIPFESGRPLPYIKVSKPNAKALLKVRSWFDGRPLTSSTKDLQNQALGRIIGRAVAHEVGHFLLGAPEHASQGLMRAALEPHLMVTPGIHHFRLQDGDVRALRAARIASCEIALRREPAGVPALPPF